MVKKCQKMIFNQVTALHAAIEIILKDINNNQITRRNLDLSELMIALVENIKQNIKEAA